jgi:hypothetical protein
MTHASFKKQGLKVDWIGLNCEKLQELDLKKVAKVLCELGFNSILAEKIDQKWETIELYTQPTNHCKVEFHQHLYEPKNKKFWVGTKINFTGENANYFYLHTHREGSQFWSTLSSVTNLKKVNLTRLDLCFDRSNTENENDETFGKFLQSCQSDLLAKYKRGVVKLVRDDKGFKLTVGSRQSTKYFRVYKKKTGTRFELEIKNKDQYLKSVQNSFFQNFRLAFEEQLINYFFSHSKKILNLNFSYTDWLVQFLQKQRGSRTSSSFLTSYFKSNYSFSSDIKELEQLYRFLQFLSFSQTQPSKLVEMASHKYQLIEFKVQDFMEFIKVKNASEYRINLLVDFFYALMNTPPLVKIFSERQFQILATFPFVHVDDTSGFCQAQVYLNYELYTYKNPFSFPESYLTYEDKYEMQIKLRIIQSFANNTLKKEFKVSEFLEKFKNTPNKTKAHIKNMILVSFQSLLQDKLIQKDITLYILGSKRKNKARLQKTLQIELKQLTPLLIGKTKTFYYFEIL